MPPDGEERRIAVHGGAILASACDDARVVTGGDDGKVVGDRRRAARAPSLRPTPKRRWIDHVALGPDGAVAWSAGKQAFVRTGKGDEREFEAPSSVGGLAFAPKGFRLAIATTTARRSGFRTPPTPRRSFSTGRARTSR